MILAPLPNRWDAYKGLAYSGWWQDKQPFMLELANDPRYRALLRWLIALPYSDVPREAELLRIDPNGVFYRVPGQRAGQTSFCIRTHAKHAKALVTRGWYGLHLLHQWDHLFADKWAPALSAGLTAFGPYYPDPNVETTTCDGYAERQVSNVSFASLRSGAGTGASDTVSEDYYLDVTSWSGGNWARIRRSFFGFDTSGIGSGQQIDDATFRLYCTAINTVVTGLSATLVSGSPASNTAVASADYAVANFGTTEFITRLAFSSWSLNAYNDMALNASGEGHINMTGVTKFGAMTNADFDNAAPTHPGTIDTGRLTIRWADRTGTTNDPILQGNYSAAGGANHTEQMAATISVAGTIAKAPAKALSGSIGVAAVSALLVAKALSGGVGVSRSAARSVTKALGAGIGVSGNIARAVVKALTGAIGVDGGWTRVAITVVTAISVAVARAVKAVTVSRASKAANVTRAAKDVDTDHGTYL